MQSPRSFGSITLVGACLGVLLLVPLSGIAQDRVRLQGTVTDAASGAPLPGATVLVADRERGTTTDAEGRYSLRLLEGTYTIVFDFVGYREVRRTVQIPQRTTLDVALEPERLSLDEVIVTDRAVENRVLTLETGLARLEVARLERLPTFMGSPDLFRGLLAKPGVSSVSEGAAGFNVRGGNVGQNQILFDGTPVYFPSHMFGLFSPFNADAVSEVTLHKSSIPVQYGSGVSSVLRVEQKVGDRSSYHLRGGVSPITSRLFLEGPIVEGKTSFVAAGRLSYVNWLLNSTDNTQLDNSQASFHDANVGVNHRFSSTDELDVMGYRAFDDVVLADTTFSYATNNASVTWKHLFSDRLFMEVEGSIGQYSFTVRDAEPTQAFTIESDVRTVKLTNDFTWDPNDRHSVSAGGAAKYYDINPGTLRPDGPQSEITPLQVEKGYGLESALYLSDEVTVTDRLAVRAGLRLSAFNRFGPARTPVFGEGAPREPRTIVDTVTTGRGETAVTYLGVDPRLSLRYSLSETSSVKLSYDRTRQYLHLLSNSTAVAPTDVWHLSTRHREPQIGDQLSAGYVRTFEEGSISSSAQVFYKWIRDASLFEPGAEPLLNTTLATDLVDGVGRAYGLEVSLQKTEGRYTGRLNYTFSRSFRRAEGSGTAEQINDGEWYPADHDQPHQLTARFTYTGDDPRVQWNFQFTYRTGRAITFPSSKFVVDGIPVANVSELNQARVPDFHRLDLSLRIDLERREQRGWNGSWTFSLFNAYGHRNVSSVFFGRDENGVPQAFSQSVLGTVFPSLTYTFEY